MTLLATISTIIVLTYLYKKVTLCRLVISLGMVVGDLVTIGMQFDYADEILNSAAWLLELSKL